MLNRMTHRINAPRFARFSARGGALTLALSSGLCLGLFACGEDDPTDAELDVELACNDYCRKAVECNDDLDMEDCENECEDSASSCMADEQDQALDELEMCSEESCDDFGGCTVGAGLQCSFGI